MFENSGHLRLGVIQANHLIDLSELYHGPGTLMELILSTSINLQVLTHMVSNAPQSAVLALDAVTPALPIQNPEKFIGVGLNYALHAKEGGHDIPAYPEFFMRAPTSLIPAEAPVVRPQCSEQLDYECELALILGKGGRHIPEERALDHVFGYTIFNDVSVRDYQYKSSQWMSGKNFDDTGPLGPYIVTADDLPLGASGLSIRTHVNGAIMQEANTSDMMFSVAHIISILSEFMTLSPGDIISTGTPSGVAKARTPPNWLRAGDKVEVEIEKIGILSNIVVDEAVIS